MVPIMEATLLQVGFLPPAPTTFPLAPTTPLQAPITPLLAPITPPPLPHTPTWGGKGRVPGGEGEGTPPEKMSMPIYDSKGGVNDSYGTLAMTTASCIVFVGCFVISFKHQCFDEPLECFQIFFSSDLQRELIPKSQSCIFESSSFVLRFCSLCLEQQKVIRSAVMILVAHH